MGVKNPLVGGQILLNSGVKNTLVRGLFLIGVKNTLVRGLFLIGVKNTLVRGFAYTSVHALVYTQKIQK